MTDIKQEIDQSLEYLKQIQDMTSSMKTQQNDISIQIIVVFVLVFKVVLILAKTFYDKHKALKEKENEKKKTQEILQTISKTVKEVKSLTSQRNIDNNIVQEEKKIQEFGSDNELYKKDK